MKRLTYYYSDELNDELSGVAKRRDVKVDKNFKFIHEGIVWKFLKLIVYKVFVMTFARLYCFFKFRIKIVGKEKIKAYKNKGYFLYGNHTQVPGDAFIHNTICYPRSSYVIVNPENIALKGTKNLIMMFGALPTPTEMSGYRPFVNSIKFYSKKYPLVIYPEAHIWPYYIGIRPFTSVSFSYPAEDNSPVFCFTNTYRKRENGKPQIITYIDGPFFSNMETKRQKQQDLRDQVYNAMCSRANMKENYAFNDYIKKEN